MLAQEAIEHAEKIIEQLKETQMMFADKNSANQIKLFNNFQNDIDALEIVLESAKLFHEKVIPMFENDHAAISPSAKPRSMFGVPLEKLGIEE